MRPLTFTPDEDLRLMWLHQQGLTHAHIAKKMHRPRGTISNRLAVLRIEQERKARAEQRKLERARIPTERRCEYAGVGITNDDLQWMQYWRHHAQQRQLLSDHQQQHRFSHDPLRSI